MALELKEKLEKLIGENADRFAWWAFDMDPESIRTPFQFANSWNNRHRGLHYVSFKTTITEDLIKMIELWSEKEENGTKEKKTRLYSSNINKHFR